MDKVSVFESSDFGEIRVMVINDQPWFVGSDIASALGYSNASKAVSAHVDEEDIDRILLTDLERFTQNGKSRINNSKVMIINESGVYSLILSSKLDSAKKFKKWVTSEVLPSIRKTGEYKTSSGGKGILVPDFSNPADAARAWADQYEAAQRAIAEKSQAEAEDPAYQKYVDTYGYHFSNALADEAVKKMVNVDGSKRIWKQPEIKDIFEKCGAKKPDKATWGDVQYVFAMYYSDGFPKVFKCENELVKATLMYLDDPDAPEGVAFIRWLAVQDYLGEKINWKDLT